MRRALQSTLHQLQKIQRDFMDKMHQLEMRRMEILTDYNAKRDAVLIARVRKGIKK